MAYFNAAEKGNETLLGRTHSDKSIPDSTKRLIDEYVNFSRARGVTDRTVLKNLYGISALLKVIGNKDLGSASKADMEQALAGIERSKYAAKTKQNIKVTVKSFYKHAMGEDLYYPKNVAWIKTSLSMKKRVLPEDILSEEDIIAMIKAAKHARDKAIISLLFDSGMRIGELLGMRVKDADLASQPAHVTVNGKTGMRKIPILFSVPYMAQYLNSIQERRPEDAMWVGTGTWHNTSGPDYAGIRKMVKDTAKAAGIGKRIYPHLFRHSRATNYANRLTEQQLKQFFGWTGDSRQAATYVHLSGRDIDNAVLEANGFEPHERSSASRLKAKTCPKCRYDNPIESIYCNRCGAPLSMEIAIAEQKTEAELRESLLESVKDPKLIEEMVHRYLEEKSKRRNARQ